MITEDDTFKCDFCGQSNTGEYYLVTGNHVLCQDYEQKIAALRAQLAEAVEALKPFAAESGMWGSKTPADEIPFIKGKDGKGDEAAFTVGDLRRAAEIVEKVTPA